MSYRGHIAKHLAKYQPSNVISGNRGAWSHQDSLAALMVCPWHPCSFCPGTICPCSPCPSPPRLDDSLIPPPVAMWEAAWAMFHIGKDPYHQVLFNHLFRIHSQLRGSWVTVTQPPKSKAVQILFACWLSLQWQHTHTTLYHTKRPNFPFCLCLHLSVPGWSDSRILS